MNQKGRGRMKSKQQRPKQASPISCTEMDTNILNPREKSEWAYHLQTLENKFSILRCIQIRQCKSKINPKWHQYITGTWGWVGLDVIQNNKDVANSDKEWGGGEHSSQMKVDQRQKVKKHIFSSDTRFSPARRRCCQDPNHWRKYQTLNQQLKLW